VWQIDAATPKCETDIGAATDWPGRCALYHHTVVPNWAVRIAGDQGSAKSIPHEVDAEIRPIGGVID
jgi:hypothetical protein